MPIIHHEGIVCEQCKHYEAYHQHPNSNAVDRHYCLKCQKPIVVHRGNTFHIKGQVIFPAGCYYNDYFEEKDNNKTRKKGERV